MDKWRSALDVARVKAGEALEITKEKAAELKEKTIEKTSELKEKYRAEEVGEVRSEHAVHGEGAGSFESPEKQRLPLQKQSREQLLETAVRMSKRCKEARAQLVECKSELEEKSRCSEELSEMVALLQAERRMPGGAAGALDALRAEVRQERSERGAREAALKKELAAAKESVRQSGEGSASWVLEVGELEEALVLSKLREGTLSSRVKSLEDVSYVVDVERERDDCRAQLQSLRTQFDDLELSATVTTSAQQPLSLLSSPALLLLPGSAEGGSSGGGGGGDLLSLDVFAASAPPLPLTERPLAAGVDDLLSLQAAPPAPSSAPQVGLLPPAALAEEWARGNPAAQKGNAEEVAAVKAELAAAKQEAAAARGAMAAQFEGDLAEVRRECEERVSAGDVGTKLLAATHEEEVRTLQGDIDALAAQLQTANTTAAAAEAVEEARTQQQQQQQQQQAVGKEAHGAQLLLEKASTELCELRQRLEASEATAQATAQATTASSSSAAAAAAAAAQEAAGCKHEEVVAALRREVEELKAQEAREQAAAEARQAAVEAAAVASTAAASEFEGEVGRLSSALAKQAQALKALASEKQSLVSEKQALVEQARSDLEEWKKQKEEGEAVAAAAEQRQQQLQDAVTAAEAKASKAVAALQQVVAQTRAKASALEEESNAALAEAASKVEGLEARAQEALRGQQALQVQLQQQRREEEERCAQALVKEEEAGLLRKRVGELVGLLEDAEREAAEAQSREEAVSAKTEAAAAEAAAVGACAPVVLVGAAASAEGLTLEKGLPTGEAAVLVWASLRKFASEHGRLKSLDLFRVFDADRSGALDASEFKQALASCGIRVGDDSGGGDSSGGDDDVVEAVMRHAGLNSKGSGVPYGAFVAALATLPPQPPLQHPPLEDGAESVAALRLELGQHKASAAAALEERSAALEALRLELEQHKASAAAAASAVETVPGSDSGSIDSESASAAEAQRLADALEEEVASLREEVGGLKKQAADSSAQGSRAAAEALALAQSKAEQGHLKKQVEEAQAAFKHALLREQKLTELAAGAELDRDETLKAFEASEVRVAALQRDLDSAVGKAEELRAAAAQAGEQQQQQQQQQRSNEEEAAAAAAAAAAPPSSSSCGLCGGLKRDNSELEGELGRLRGSLVDLEAAHASAVDKLKGSRNKGFEVLTAKHQLALSALKRGLDARTAEVAEERDAYKAEMESVLAQQRKANTDHALVLQQRLSAQASDHASTVASLNDLHAKGMSQVSEATALAEQRDNELTALRTRFDALAAEHRNLRRTASELELQAHKLEGSEAALAGSEQRLRLLEAEEGRIEELEVLIVQLKAEAQDSELRLTDALQWQQRHAECEEAKTKGTNEFTSLLREKDEMEKKQFEAELKATRLQAELTSSRKALRQAVAQLQQLEVEQQQHVVMMTSAPRKGGGAAVLSSSPSLLPTSGGGACASTPTTAAFNATAANTVTSSAHPGNNHYEPSLVALPLSATANTPNGGGGASLQLVVGDRVAKIRERMTTLLNKVAQQHGELNTCRARIDDLECDAKRKDMALDNLDALLKRAKAKAQAATLAAAAPVAVPSGNEAPSTPPPPNQEGSGRVGNGGEKSGERGAGGGGSGFKGRSATGAANHHPQTSLSASSSSSSSSSSKSSLPTAGLQQPAVAAAEAAAALTHLKCAVLEFILSNPDDNAKRAQLTAMIAKRLHFTKRETEAALAVASTKASDSDPLAFLHGILT